MYPDARAVRVGQYRAFALRHRETHQLDNGSAGPAERVLAHDENPYGRQRSREGRPKHHLCT